MNCIKRAVNEFTIFPPNVKCKLQYYWMQLILSTLIKH